MEMLHFHSQYSELSLGFPENFLQSKGIENVELVDPLNRRLFKNP